MVYFVHFPEDPLEVLGALMQDPHKEALRRRLSDQQQEMLELREYLLRLHAHLRQQRERLHLMEPFPKDKPSL
jgi:hypothetical protein